MSEFVSLSPSGLPEDFDVSVSSEKAVVSVEEREDRIEINYIFPGFRMSDRQRQVDDQTLSFKEVGISGAGFVSVSGKPLLPSFGRFIQIPPGCRYEVHTKRSKPVEYENILITPAQEEATDQVGAGQEFEYDEDAYGKDAWYPDNVVEVGPPQNMDDYRVLIIHVRPLQYNPAKRLLLGYSNIHVTIRLYRGEADEAKIEEFPLMDPVANREGFGNLLLNPSRRIVERIPVRGMYGAPPVPIDRGPEYLIIYDSSLKRAAINLADWKNKKGLTTETVSIGTVGNSVAAIKKYIRDRRSSYMSRLRYVLLFGDVGAIPAEERSGNTTDHYYFTKNDPAGSSDCVLPWVSGGRIPVNTLEEANAVVDQIVKYEKAPPCDAEYYRRMTLAAFFQDDPTQDGQADRAYMKTMEKIREHMVSIGFAVDRVYVSNNPNPQHYVDGTAVPAAVRNAIVDNDTATDMLLSAISEGQLVIGHRDHGDWNGWYRPSLRNEHLPSILSTYPSVFYSINCLTGRFDSDPSDSFAEAVLKFNGGPPSLIAATESSGTWRNDSMMKGLFDAVWPGVIDTFPGTTASYAVKYNRLGDILNYAKSYLLVAHGMNSGVKDHFEIYHVVGDPTLQLWAEAPAPIQVSASMPSKGSLNIHVSPVPVDGVVTIWYLGKLIKRASVSSSRMSIPMGHLMQTPPNIPRFMRLISVCVAGPGHRFAYTHCQAV